MNFSKTFLSNFSLAEKEKMAFVEATTVYGKACRPFQASQWPPQLIELQINCKVKYLIQKCDLCYKKYALKLKSNVVLSQQIDELLPKIMAVNIKTV